VKFKIHCSNKHVLIDFKMTKLWNCERQERPAQQRCKNIYLQEICLKRALFTIRGKCSWATHNMSHLQHCQSFCSLTWNQMLIKRIDKNTRLPISSTQNIELF
jgi:3-phenylpropionate/cinnamic acid dioxygenase small subunit